jgi:O-antigen/teichoic acid export membrane protein
MLSNIKTALKNSAIYGLGNMATKLIGFVLLPIYMKKFPLSEYGALGLLEATAQVIIVVFAFNLYAGFTRWYFEPELKEKQREFFSSVFMFLLFVVFSALFLLHFFSSEISFAIFNSEKYEYVLKLMFFAAGAEILSGQILTILKLDERAAYYSFLSLVKLTVNLILTIYFIVYLNQGVEGIYHAQLFGHSTFFIFSLPLLKNKLRFFLDLKLIQEIFSYSFPLMLSSVSLLLLTQVDRYMLGSMKALESVGEYSLGFKFANFVKVFIVFSVQLAISPMIYKMIHKPEAKRFYSKIMTYFTFGLAPFSLIVSLFGGDIIQLLSTNKDYFGAEKVIPIISLSIIFGMLKDTAVIGLNIAKKTKIIATITVIISLFNIILNYFLIPVFDSIGAAYSTLISQILYFGFIYFHAQKNYKIPYEMYKVFLVIILSLLIFFLSRFFVLHTSFKLILIFLLPIFLYPFNFYEKIEIETIKNFLNKLRFR